MTTSTGSVTRAVAQGTFDILHPGHLHYLRDAAERADRLHVIVARDGNVTHKSGPVVPETQRVEMVRALDPVDRARLGHPEDIFVPIREIDPNVIVLGHDQYHTESEIAEELAEAGIDCAVERATGREPADDELLSSGEIAERAMTVRADDRRSRRDTGPE
ncbi:MAG: adenylyltransferase/cytidyltransferase family protein [Salinirussus sp.]